MTINTTSQKLSSDVLVIGGGIQGASTAYHLAQRGVSVIVVEKDTVSRHASGVNAGGVRLLGRNIAEVELSKAAMQRWQQLDDELDADTGFRRRSLINIAADEKDLESLRAREQQMHSLDYFHEVMLNQQELRERLPHVAAHCVGGVVSEQDGYAIPFHSTQAFRIAAERLGACFCEGEQVEQIRKVGDSWLVDTKTQQYQAEHLVNCAGAWGDIISVMIGDNVPMSYSAPMLMITARMPHFAGPVVGAVSRPLSFKQFENGTVLIGGGAKGFADRANNITRLDYSLLATGAQNAIEFFPIMKTACINRMWSGLEAYMPDNLPVLGKSMRTDKAYHAFAFSAHGFQLGPVIGEVMADLITKGETRFDLEPLRVNRYERKTL
ncbi:NAD(P)/FAD-dependent oxidoreductase [Amphritea japonica]|uniref:Sarcosine oxidase, subunit beta n=1 Tax=Amphritea japonica ATCC BAA-1530 TaxID=1278309 RepID=A0A7R6SS67_9GAMM|nr:FAD-binding oxidoreductase [Amphritea japonica]BBB25350.1 sarcosine oxidase, subunit beta [Amphritea japonica ATCC BAA-1530]